MSFNEALMKVEKGYYKRMILDKLEFIQHNLLTTNDIEKTISEGYSNILSLISKLKSFNIQTENPLLDLVNDLGTNDNRKSSILSNLSKLDKLTNGIPRGHLTIIGGRSSMGKSAFAFNLLLNFLNKGLKCTFFSLETSHRYLIYRLLSIKCRMNYDKVINRIFNQKETQDLKDFVNLVNY